jgi:hypothetical protein
MNTLYLMRMGWTVFPGMNAPGLKGNNAFLKCAFRITNQIKLKIKKCVRFGTGLNRINLEKFKRRRKAGWCVLYCREKSKFLSAE